MTPSYIKTKGEKEFLCVTWPASEHIILGDGTEFFCEKWPTHISNCFINGKRVKPSEYRKARDANVTGKQER